MDILSGVRNDLPVTCLWLLLLSSLFFTVLQEHQVHLAIGQPHVVLHVFKARRLSDRVQQLLTFISSLLSIMIKHRMVRHLRGCLLVFKILNWYFNLFVFIKDTHFNVFPLMPLKCKWSYSRPYWINIDISWSLPTPLFFYPVLKPIFTRTIEL